MDDVALQSDPENQSRGPVGEHWTERHMQTVQAQTVTVIGPVRHGQSVHHAPHGVSRVVVLPSVHVMAGVVVVRRMTAVTAVRLVRGVVSGFWVCGVRLLTVTAVVAGRRIRRCPKPKLDHSAIECRGDLLRVRDPDQRPGRRNTAPHVRHPVASVDTRIAGDHEQIRVRRRGHAPPSPPCQLRLDRETFARCSWTDRRQNSGSGHRHPYERASQLHLKAPSRQA
ncbi:hypothetical protein ABZ848_12235 [Streptomyces sp. NPDC047081]|uniref:hypothetical protein n=1 Tax=Streptomyces sp. NPDC047081 TaxID=3154706 RepID=UPI0033D66B38